MSSRMPPRYLPTLTEVVDPNTVHAREEAIEPMPAPQTLPEPVFEAVPAPQLPPEPALEPLRESVQAAVSAPPTPATPDRHALAQQLIKLVQPQLEAELRSIAQELFEAQFSALLPSLHLHIEEAVREALDQALPSAPDGND